MATYCTTCATRLTTQDRGEVIEGQPYCQRCARDQTAQMVETIREKKRGLADIIVTTTGAVDGYDVVQYCGTISAISMLALDEMDEWVANMRDWWGGKSRSYGNKYAELHQDVEAKLKYHAASLGGNAVVGATFEVKFIETETGAKRKLTERNIIERKLLVSGAGTAVALAAHARISEAPPSAAPSGRALGGGAHEMEGPEDLVAKAEACRAEEDWRGLAECLVYLAEESSDSAEIIGAFMELAEVFAVRLDDPEGALTTYEHVIEIDPTNESALLQLELLYGEMERWERLLEIYSLYATRSVDAERRVDALAKCAILYEEVLDRPQDAIECLRRILEDRPEDADTKSTLERLVREAAEGASEGAVGSDHDA